MDEDTRMFSSFYEVDNFLTDIQPLFKNFLPLKSNTLTLKVIYASDDEEESDEEAEEPEEDEPVDEESAEENYTDDNDESVIRPRKVTLQLPAESFCYMC